MVWMENFHYFFESRVSHHNESFGNDWSFEKLKIFQVYRHIPIGIHIVRRAIVRYVKLEILPNDSRKILSHDSANVIKWKT